MFTGRLSRCLGSLTLAVALAAGGVTFTSASSPGPARADVTTAVPTGNGPSVAVLSGDFTGDGKADIAVTGSQYFGSVPVAASAGDGSFATPAGTLSDTGWPSWSSVPGVRVLTGDFNGDHKADLALVPPPGNPWWSTLPVAMSHGYGSFTVTNAGGVGPFANTWAQISGVQVVTGDFNGDGKTDIALAGGPGWGSVPVAFANGDGTFHVVNDWLPVVAYASWAATPGLDIVYKNANDHSLAVSQVWVAYGQAGAASPLSFAAPVILDTATITATAAATGPAPAGITLTAYTGPAAPAATNETCDTVFQEANGAYWMEKYYNRIARLVYKTTKLLALDSGASADAAETAGLDAADPYLEVGNQLLEQSGDRQQQFQTMRCPGSPIGPDPFGDDG